MFIIKSNVNNLKIVQEEFEETKVVIRIRKSKKDRQYNGQQKKNKSTNSDLQNTTQKTKDRTTRTSLKQVVNSDAVKSVSNYSSTSGTRVVCVPF